MSKKEEQKMRKKALPTTFMSYIKTMKDVWHQVFTFLNIEWEYPVFYLLLAKLLNYKFEKSFFAGWSSHHRIWHVSGCLNDFFFINVRFSFLLFYNEGYMKNDIRSILKNCFFAIDRIQILNLLRQQYCHTLLEKWMYIFSFVGIKSYGIRVKLNNVENLRIIKNIVSSCIWKSFPPHNLMKYLI